MKNHRKSTLLMVLACVLLAAGLLSAFGAAGAFAALGDTTAVVRSELRAAKVTCRVNDGSYTVTNTGNIPALIRVKLVINWVDDNGDIMMYPPEGAEYQLTPGTNWTHMGSDTDPCDGFWYCNRILSAGEMTPRIVSELVQTGDGNLRVEILAEAIQATPAEVVEEAWGMSYTDGNWSK